MKKTKSPIWLERIEFYSYNFDEKDEAIEHFDYDDGRRDFLIDRNLCGIAAHLMFDNLSDDKGVRRVVSLSLIDITMREEVALRKIKLRMTKDELLGHLYVNFPIETVPLRGGHHYKLVVSDETTGIALFETNLHFYDRDQLGKPKKWYTPLAGGIRIQGMDELYKMLPTIDYYNHYVRFNLRVNFNHRLLKILPALELRLYYPDGLTTDTMFEEPQYDYKGRDYDSYYVEYPFTTSDENNGVFYGELLCMGTPIGGIVFDTMKTSVEGTWSGDELAVIPRYTPQKGIRRLDELISAEKEKYFSEDTELKKLIRELIEERNIDDEEEDNDREETIS